MRDVHCFVVAHCHKSWYFISFSLLDSLHSSRSQSLCPCQLCCDEGSLGSLGFCQILCANLLAQRQFMSCYGQLKIDHGRLSSERFDILACPVSFYSIINVPVTLCQLDDILVLRFMLTNFILCLRPLPMVIDTSWPLGRRVFGLAGICM